MTEATLVAFRASSVLSSLSFNSTCVWAPTYDIIDKASITRLEASHKIHNCRYHNANYG